MKFSPSATGAQLRVWKAESDRLAKELRSVFVKMGSALDSVRSDVGEIGFPDFLSTEFNASQEDLALYAAHARSSDEEMAAVSAKARAVAAEHIPALPRTPGSLDQLANDANRMDGQAFEYLRLSGEARQAVGVILTEAAGRFESTGAFYRWLDEHFLSGAERAKAFMMLARHNVPAVSSFDLFHFEHRLKEELDKVCKRALDEPPGPDDPVKANELDATVVRAHWAIAQQAIGTSHASVQIAAQTVRSVKSELSAPDFARWVELTGQSIEQVEGLLESSRPGESLADMMARSENPNSREA